MSEEIAEILATCLERIEAGASVESCLADYPQQAAELEPLLRMTQQMKALTNAGPRPMFARGARLNLENQLATSPKAVTFERRHRRTKHEPRLLLQRRFSMSALQLFLAAVLALTGTTGGVAYAANASNPGDALHGLDLAMENIQLNLTPDVASKVELRLQFASERLKEAQATFDKGDTTDGEEALNEYGTEISAAAQLVGGAGGADQDALATLLQTAQGVHQTVLTQLLDKVPDQAKEAIQKAIDASGNSGKPENVGKPDQTGKPDGVGNPNGTGKPDNTGKPSDAGNPNSTNDSNNTDSSSGNGNSNGVGVDVSACAKSISNENAQALAALAKQHGVDYQYVLDNFCATGTLEKVQEMLSSNPNTPGKPTDVPAGPPSGTPGAPANHPGKP